MMRWAGRLLCLALGLAGLAPAHAQDQRPASARKSDSHDIIVTGRREKEIRRFVEELAPSRYGRQLGRWNAPICAEIRGLEQQPTRAAMLKTRIETVARSLRIAVDSSPECVANIRIVFTDYADALAAEVVRRFPEFVKDVEHDGLPHKADTAPLLAPRAVRWFSADAEGDRDVGTFPGGAPSDLAVGRGASTPHIRFSMPSRIKLDTQENAIYSFVIVDNGKLAHTTWAQLADYLALITLARPDIKARYKGQDTIMAMFEDRDAAIDGPDRMTPQDRALLKGLYLADPNKSPLAQHNEIYRHILHTSSSNDVPIAGDAATPIASHDEAQDDQ